MKFIARLRRPVHPAYLIGVLCVGIVLGVLVAWKFPSSWLVHWVWLLVFCGILIPLVMIRRVWAIFLICVVGVMIGYSRGNGDMQGVLQSQKFIGSTVEVAGAIEEDPGTGASSGTTFRVLVESINGQSAGGVLWATSSDNNIVKRGDRVVLSGKMSAGFGPFVGSLYRANFKIVKRDGQQGTFVAFRDWFSDAISSSLPETEAALGAGYVLGEKQALPADFEEALRIVGLTHVVVASGYNLTILVRLARRLFSRVSRYTALLAGAASTLSFIGITGMSPSMTRAGIVAGLSLLVWYYGRKIHPAMILALSAAVSVMIRPAYAWGDVGWLLSFTAFAGVMFLAPLLQDYFFGDKPAGTVRQIIGETLSAQIMTMPIIIAMFGTVSTVALLANILVLPLVPLAMLLVFGTGLVTLFLPAIAWLIAMPTQWLLGYMVEVVWLLSGLSWASFEVEWSAGAVVASYGVIALILVALWRRTDVRFIDVNIVR